MSVWYLTYIQMCSFDSPEAFISCTFAERDVNGYSVRAIRKNTTLYRVDSSGKKIASSDVPIFLTDKETLQPYLRGTSFEDSGSKYTLTRKVVLFEMIVSNIQTLIQDTRLTQEDLLFLSHFISRDIASDSISARLGLPKNFRFL